KEINTDNSFESCLPVSRSNQVQAQTPQLSRELSVNVSTQNKNHHILIVATPEDRLPHEKNVPRDCQEACLILRMLM
ncbi:hypothetical protein, partial [Streptococcus pyogenes]|uniref:hypothetical protein n=1 Tax=Streptococcus pyogenes TaxID=1314 RepID=UPI003DA0342E